MLSKSCKYAIRAVLYLAKNPTKKIGSRQIAETLKIPAPFLAKTLQELTRKEIISSAKGPNGGFYLSDKNKDRKIIDIIRCIDGNMVFDTCLIGKPECNNENPCEVHYIYASFKKRIMTVFSDINIVDLIKDETKIKSVLK